MNNSTLWLIAIIGLVAIVLLIVAGPRLKKFTFRIFGLGHVQGEVAAQPQPTTTATVTKSVLKKNSSVSAEGAMTAATVHRSEVGEGAEVSAKNPPPKP